MEIYNQMERRASMVKEAGGDDFFRTFAGLLVKIICGAFVCIQLFEVYVLFLNQ